MAKDAAAMQAIASNANEALRHALIDAVYPQIEDINIAEIAFHGRFGIWLSSANYPIITSYLAKFLSPATEVPWSVEAARQLYDIMRSLPSSQVVPLKVVTTSSRTNGIAGKTWPDSGHINLDFVGKNDVDTGAFTSSKSDKMRGLNLNKTTTLHEVAHLLDINQKYSRTPAFRSFSGWKEYASIERWKIVDTITENSPTPTPPTPKQVRKNSSTGQ